MAERAGVRALIEDAVGRPVVLVSAPSGFGKTVAVAAWARTSELPVAWLTLTSFDTDVARIDSLVVDALRRVARARTSSNADALRAV